MNNKITYTLVGDYLLPDIKPSDPEAPPLGRYGLMHKAYLQEHRPILYNTPLLTERLYPLCRKIDEAAAQSGQWRTRLSFLNWSTADRRCLVQND